MITRDEVRFWQKVRKATNPDDCWEWIGAKVNPERYGSFWWGRRRRGAHLFSYELHFGNVPPGNEVCHTCDNPSCVNPGHLFLSDHAGNMRDGASKGHWSHEHLSYRRIRESGKVESGDSRRARGTNNGASKLTESQVLAIRERYAVGGISQRKLAEEYGVHQSNIRSILLRMIWKHV